MQGLQLLDGRKKKGALNVLFSRVGLVAVLFLVSTLVFGVMLEFTAEDQWVVALIIFVFDVSVIIYIINTDHDASVKLTWILVIVVTSTFGALLYAVSQINMGVRKVRRFFYEEISSHRKDLRQDEEVLQQLQEDSNETADLVTYLNRSGVFPAHAHCDVTYYSLGEEKWRDMLVELEKAEKFIFLEYFIVDEGLMWGTILEILARKAAEGVDVRLMYDGTCAITPLPYDYPKRIRELGIQCKMFSPIRPFISTRYNYRDHRKILVIDGKVAFTGGVNLADEYINHIDLFGHWKDTAIRVKGPAVRSFTFMFLTMWNSDGDRAEYRPYLEAPVEAHLDKKGYVIPYGDNPFDKDKVGQKVYMDLLNRANSYVHIMTPYLVPDDSLLGALKYAAERGVDVKMILPGIPDKAAVYALAKTYFATLMESGVEIYLYTPGFVHAKTVTSDDKKAVVGTINWDYRSLYHHFECAAYMYDVECIPDIEADFQATLEKCERVTEQTLKSRSFGEVVAGKAMKLIAPLV